MDKHISDDDDFYTDEEDEEWNAPITAAWGAPSSEQEPGSVEENDGSGDVNGWHQIADPNAKLRADGVGAGNLHRQGKNFKPVDESYIVNQRLGKAAPKKTQAKPVPVHTKATPKVSIRSVSGSKPPHVISAPEAGKKAAKKARQAALALAAERARAVEMAAAKKRPPSKVEDVQVQSTWAAGASLVTTPFWEQSSSMSSVHARQPQQQNEAQSGKPSRTPVAQTQKPAFTPAPAPQSASKFGMQIKGLGESMRKLEIARAASAAQAAEDARSSARSVSTGRDVAAKSKSVPPETRHTPKPAIPLNKPNSAPPKLKTKQEPVQPSKPRQPTSFTPAPAPKPTTSTKEISSAHSKWANPAAVPAAILFTLNIELEKGETMPITIRANDDPRQLAVAFVERFRKRSGDGASVNNNNVVEALTHLIQQQIKIKSGKA
ncbi:hypothetical protein K450DRAFT_243108 [Umbelopsis ramanniana AG]|uniref:Uncharacterized protein n=1 Tax=Umbelopsis ramanniana AG TaxID=1314678 RepID=A0AAD5E8B3_UMBRA|nr:uncharacterized protein K450DRAFT_243108 [Umbelopsis ramanniana AG]KAI8579171.1 hypothetical protein K450DRAFT_243108 [Umbelopsis ramanniana AG]